MNPVVIRQIRVQRCCRLLVMNTQDELRQAMADLKRGTFIKEGAR